jgi:predicted metal-binding membrane protein
MAAFFDRLEKGRHETASFSDEEAAARRIERLSDYALAAGYLMAWTLFSFGATALQRFLAKLVFVSSTMEVTSLVVGATLLFVAARFRLRRPFLGDNLSPVA